MLLMRLGHCHACTTAVWITFDTVVIVEYSVVMHM